MVQAIRGFESHLFRHIPFFSSFSHIRQKVPAFDQVFGPGTWWIGSMMNGSGSDIQVFAMYSQGVNLLSVLSRRACERARRSEIAMRRSLFKALSPSVC
jgi:hypothetical protein